MAQGIPRIFGALCPPWDIMPWLLRAWDISVIVVCRLTIERVDASTGGPALSWDHEGRLEGNGSVDPGKACPVTQPEAIGIS